MIPAEKAKDLINKLTKEDLSFWEARQSALVAVNEILNFLNDDFKNWMPYKSDVTTYLEQTGIYWKQVKEEIEKL